MSTDIKRHKTTKFETVVLKKPHEHAGEIHPEGAELKLRPDQVERLRKEGKV